MLLKMLHCSSNAIFSARFSCQQLLVARAVAGVTTCWTTIAVDSCCKFHCQHCTTPWCSYSSCLFFIVQLLAIAMMQFFHWQAMLPSPSLAACIVLCCCTALAAYCLLFLLFFVNVSHVLSLLVWPAFVRHYASSKIISNKILFQCYLCSHWLTRVCSM